MDSQSRRFQRFLRSRGDAYKTHIGGLEHVLPGRLLGWVFGDSGDFHEVRLLVGAHLIARAQIDETRQDVCNRVGKDGTPGFSLLLPAEIPPLDWKEEPCVIALSSDGKRNAELKLIKDPKNTGKRIRQILQSEAIGLEGHFDGVIDETMKGWAGRRNQVSSARIWLHSSNNAPIEIVCDKYRSDLLDIGMPGNCGFEVSPQGLSDAWKGQEVWFTFDQKGEYRLPGEAIKLSEHKVKEEISSVDIVRHVVDGKSPESDLNRHWEALERFREFLDEVEAEIVRQECLDIQRKGSGRILSRWARRFLGNFH